jgi:tetratricopeptide (TPR) repeat protein
MRPLFLFVAALALLVVAGPTAAKERYNVWAKEKIRFHVDKVRSDPYNPQLRVLLANAFFGDGDYWKAATELEKAIELDPEYPEAHSNLGVVRHAQSMLADAESHYREALRLDSTLVDAMAGLGTMLCANGRRAEGIEFLEMTLVHDGRRDDARFNLAVAYHKVDDYLKAIEHLEKLYERSPGFPGVRRGLSQAYFARGLVLLQAEMPDRALTLFGQSEELRDDAPNLFYAKGLAHLDLDDLGAAERAFARAVSLDEEHVPALHNLAFVLEQTGRAAEAEPYYRRVARLTPHIQTIEAARHASYDEKILLE